MKHVDIPGTNLRPSSLALGTAVYGSAIRKDAAFELMDAYADAGGNVLDTAHVYASWLPDGEGKSESTIGEWLTSRGLRAEFIISTKGAHPDLGTGKTRFSPEDMRMQLSESLDRLQTDCVDIYWLHRDDPQVPVGEMLGWLNEIMADGLVGAIGCSNWSVARQREAARDAEAHGVTGFCASQIGWSLAKWFPGGATGGMLHMDRATFAFHKQTGTPVFAFSSQAGGFFAGKYDAVHKDPACDPHVRTRFAHPTNVARLEAARALASKKSVSPNQVAVAWLLNQPFPAIAIVGPRTAEQAADSFAAGDLALSADEIAYLGGGVYPA